MFPHLLSLRIEVQKVKHVGKYVQPWTLMLLIYTMYNSLSLHLPTLLQRPCLRRWNHSSMSLFWNAIVLTGDPPAQSSCKFRYQVAKNARPCVLRDSRGRNLIYPAWLRTAKNARCCVQRGMLARQESTLP